MNELYRFLTEGDGLAIIALFGVLMLVTILRSVTQKDNRLEKHTEEISKLHQFYLGELKKERESYRADIERITENYFQLSANLTVALEKLTDEITALKEHIYRERE